MPTSIATATVIALAIIPGALGAYMWALVNGRDWRDKDWQSAVRFLGFSILGLGAYVLAAAWMRLPPAIHVLPSTYEAGSLRADDLADIFLPYLGHIVGAILIGGFAAVAHRVVCAIRGSSPQPSTWDHFVKNAVPSHWVVVRVKSGDAFAGYIQTAEESAPDAERDVILRYPAKFDEASGNYCVTSLKDLFLPAELIQNIGTVRSDSELDAQPLVGTFLFPETSKNERSEVDATVTEAITGTAG